MKTIFEYINLQLFADAGTLVNATGSFVNAYEGTTTAFDAAHTMDGELKTFYDTELLENARVELFYAQFARSRPFPRSTARPWSGESGTPLQRLPSFRKVLFLLVRSSV